ncbi:hypothetical protein EWM64_g873 [Hericium alpestre]|uniref:Uncharacterized protein n=1 Tax=Hericium alpestre TaxID=135208 RepID=A0A4Z0ABZ0_9AGAM|nr:hypothetical protein EWM64_g873 [Hericium alpestre]
MPAFAALILFLAPHLFPFALADASNPDASASVSHVPNFKIIIISIAGFLTLIALIFGLPYIMRHQATRSREAFELTSLRRNAGLPQRRRRDISSGRLSVPRPSASLQGDMLSPAGSAVQAHPSPVTNGDGRPIRRPALAPPSPALTADVVRTHGGALAGGVDSATGQPIATSSRVISSTELLSDVTQSSLL